MAKPIANVSITTDTFAGWLAKTNILLYELSNEIVTVTSTTGGANTTGNGSVIGILTANTIGADLIRGGGVGNTANISSLSIGFANSTVSSNVKVSGYTTNVNSNNLNITANTVLGTGTQNVVIATANLRITTNTLVVNASSNVELNSSLIIANELAVNNSIEFDSKVLLLSKTTNIYFPDPTTANTVDSFSISEFNGAKYTINVSDDSDSNNKVFTEISVIYGHGRSHMTEYGTIYSNTRFMTFSTSSNSTHVILSANSSESDATFRIHRTTFV